MMIYSDFLTEGMTVAFGQGSRFSLPRLALAACTGLLLAAPAGPWQSVQAAEADSAVIFTYHRFGDSRYPSTNTTLAQFDAQLREISAGGYKVLPLPRIIEAFRRKEALPERAIALTIDDAFASVYANAWPRLQRLGLPFTLFVTTNPVNAGGAEMMTWGQVREMAAAGVTIGHHSADHGHLPDLDAAGLRRQLEMANRHFQAQLAEVPKLFAYPFGEFGQREKQAAEGAGFLAAFGQQSGVAHAKGDFFAVPRFAMNEQFGAVARFRLAANALPLPVIDQTPADWVLRGANPPSFGFTLVGPSAKGRGLRCYASSQTGPLAYERLAGRRIEVRLDKAFGIGRSRINCTMPAEGNRWRWFGAQFYVPG